MKYGLDVSTAGSYADPRVLADLAAEAEDAGWDGFFVWDTVFFVPGDWPVADPWVALAAIAMQTRRIRIGAMVTPLARRRPWQVARETVSLDHLSDGRLIFGAGLGYQAVDFAAFGEEADPKIRAEKLDEGLQVLSGLWTGESFSFQGNHYQVNAVTFLPKPMQSPRIPVWIAGFWPNHRPFRRAARWDGTYIGTQKVNGEILTPEELKEVVAYVKAHRGQAEPFDVAFAGQTPSDPEEGMEIVHPYIEAGLTWWLEGIEDVRGSLEEMRERIRSGPPKM
ncbi:MAG: LLM class flavin-dependent oxidoreductase [Candidatus Tectomicrobia bacterium]|nr:LLM class flavin-dependent oxidoreductase [Candidatus Tectomicrobia bacterium]